MYRSDTVDLDAFIGGQLQEHRKGTLSRREYVNFSPHQKKAAYEIALTSRLCCLRRITDVAIISD